MSVIRQQVNRLSGPAVQSNFEQASLSLEAALILPLVLALFLQLALSLYALAAELDAEAALFRLSQEATLMLSGQSYREKHTNEKQSNEVPVKANAADNSLFKQLLRDAGLSYLTLPLAETRLAAWFAGLHDQEIRFPLIKNSRIFIETPDSAKAGRLHFYYQIPGLWENVPRSTTHLLTDWSGRTGSRRAEEKKPPAESADALWQLDNFNRGKAFQSRYGANLSEFHPIVAKTDGRGGVSMIRSIDLTKQTYLEAGNLEKKISDCLAELRAFSGTDESGPVLSRELIVIVPENSPAQAWQSLNLRKAEAAGCGIRLTLIQDGRSD